jgi:hypothetical protein
MRTDRRLLLRAAVAAGASIITSGCAIDGVSGAGSGVRKSTVDEDVREFGISSDPWHVDDWAAAVGARPTMVMEFEAFSRRRTITNHLMEARRQGLRAFMVTWEPWVSVRASQGKAAQYREQPEYSNAAIASGRWDDYLHAFARSVAGVELRTYIRYAHEMNGDWYPWSRDPPSYVRAWRRVVDIFRAEGANNAKFVFSVNPSLWQDRALFEPTMRRYWPGDGHVDYLGSTMISFGGRKDYTVAEFADRLAMVHTAFGKELIVTELNTALSDRVRWLTDLRTWLVTEAHWVRGVVLSQGSSRGQEQLGSQVGDLSWEVTTDPETQPVVRAIIADLVGDAAGGRAG